VVRGRVLDSRNYSSEGHRIPHGLPGTAAEDDVAVWITTRPIARGATSVAQVALPPAQEHTARHVGGYNVLATGDQEPAAPDLSQTLKRKRIYLCALRVRAACARQRAFAKAHCARANSSCSVPRAYPGG